MFVKDAHRTDDIPAAPPQHPDASGHTCDRARWTFRWDPRGRDTPEEDATVVGAIGRRGDRDGRRPLVSWDERP